MTRILFTAGKGGVGKSTVAAATAVLAARRGLRTLVASIDSAHNLGDVLQAEVGGRPVAVGERLEALEVDLNRELADNWSSVTDFLRSMTASNPRVSRLVAEECAVLPGMEEVFGLLRVDAEARSGNYDLIVVDSPPTGDMLKLLRLPDVLEWFMEKYQPFEQSRIRMLRPIAEAAHLFVPDDSTLRELDQWYRRVRRASTTLTDPEQVTVRLVMTPDRVALAETRRAFTWTCLLGMSVDGVIVNRILPDEEAAGWMAGWLARGREVLAEAELAFAAVPVLRAGLQPAEVLGPDALLGFAEALYGERDPTANWSPCRPIEWWEEGPVAELRLHLPFLRKGEFRLLAGAEGLSVIVGNQRQILPVPPSIRRRPLAGAGYADGWLTVRFGPAEAASRDTDGSGQADER